MSPSVIFVSIVSAVCAVTLLLVFYYERRVRRVESDLENNDKEYYELCEVAKERESKAARVLARAEEAKAKYEAGKEYVFVKPFQEKDPTFLRWSFELNQDERWKWLMHLMRQKIDEMTITCKPEHREVQIGMMTGLDCVEKSVIGYSMEYVSMKSSEVIGQQPENQDD